MAKSHSNSQIAKRYATALFRISGANASKLLPEVLKLAEIAKLEDVTAFFHNPLLTRDAQAGIVKNLLESQGFSKILVDTTVRVALNRRLVLLGEILMQYKAMVMQAMNEMEVEIISAKPLSENDVATLAAQLGKNYNKKIHATTKTDPSLIGGIMLKMQDGLIDYSIAGKLNRLQHYLKTA